MTVDLTTEEGNKFIAEFNGGVLITNDPMFMGGNVSFYSLNINGIKRNYRPHDLQYHSSWDWLNPAWSEFYKLCEPSLRYLETEKLYNEFADFRDNYNTHVNHNNVKAAFDVLVKAIQWLNQKQIINEK